VQLDHSLISLENTVNTQIRLGGEGLADVAEQLLEALRPAVRQTLMEVVEGTAREISSQLVGQEVEIRVRDGEPELVVTDLAAKAPAGSDPENLEARLTLRLPESLKSMIENAADDTGDSINSWVVGALRSKTMSQTGSSVKTTIDL
jgi:predicted HicB family RNase H-like nuclease